MTRGNSALVTYLWDGNRSDDPSGAPTFNLGRGAEAVAPEDLLEVLCTRPLTHVDAAVLRLETTYVKSRRGSRAVYETVVKASAEGADGSVEAVGVDIGDSEDPSFWARFLLTLKARGLDGVGTVVSEHHGPLEDALDLVFPGARWQRDDSVPVLLHDDVLPEAR